MPISYLALGSNLGNTSKNIQDAYALICLKCTTIKKSQTILSKPYGITEQLDFANSVIKVETDLQPLELLNFVKSIEKKLDRVTSQRWGERLIDIKLKNNNLTVEKKCNKINI